MYKTMNYLAPEYLQSLFSQRHSAYNLRNWRKADPVQTKRQLFETKLFLQRAMLWNNLPKSLSYQEGM